ncbi:MAG: deoxyhypusine synthase family protein [Bryobacteraceae bacterium]
MKALRIMHNHSSHSRPVAARRVDECDSLHDIFTQCLPSFGGAHLRRVYTILDKAIGAGCPLTLAVAGPVTISGQHQSWLIPLLETGWVAYLSTTDAVCYHDGHRALDGAKPADIQQVPIFGDDAKLLEEGTIRITDLGFPESWLLDQDRFVSSLLQLPEFQRKMTGPEFRSLLGKRFGALEKRNGVTPGLLSRCHDLAVPVFVGAPGDGSVFLNSMKLWAMRESGLIANYEFDLDLHGEVFDACAFHWWGLFDQPSRSLATLILGGGVPKNFNLQPEPALSQIFGLKDAHGYAFDVQIVTAPVTDGSLSSCYPAEAVTWGKVDKDTYQQSTESLQADYSTLMPFIVKALLDNRRRWERMAGEMGAETLFARRPEARGYLRPRAGYRLMDRREALRSRLLEEVRNNGDWLRETLHYPLP